MRLVVAVIAAALVLGGCSSSTEPEASQPPSPTNPASSSNTSSASPTTSDSDDPPDKTDMLEQPAGRGGAIGCTTRDDCDIEFDVNSVSRHSCDSYSPVGDYQLVRVEIEARARQEIAFPNALDIFNLGSWSALTDDGYTLRSLDITGMCDGEDSSLLAYGINAGEKVRNTIDFVVPTNAEKIQLQPAALEGGGWNWEITDQS